MNKRIKVGIAGAGGYTGVTLLSILLKHPYVDVEWISSEEAHTGKKLTEIFPHFVDIHYRFLPLEECLKKKVDVVFTALPHSVPMNYAAKILESGAKLIDLSADFRFTSPETFERWYGVKHSAPSLLKEAVYGLPEIYRDKIKKANVIGNPGCYPTASILGLYPIIKEKLAEYPVIIDAKSGVSGGGRGLSLRTHFSEVNEGVLPYSIFTHRHLPEIEEKLREFDDDASVIFTPHLIPMTRGITATIYIKLKKKVGEDEIREIYRKTYMNERFVKIVDVIPSSKFVSGTNMCLIWVGIKDKNAIVISSIDNLVKGASGQAVQNMNIAFGFEEGTGLDIIPLFP